MGGKGRAADDAWVGAPAGMEDTASTPARAAPSIQSSSPPDPIQHLPHLILGQHHRQVLRSRGPHRRGASMRDGGAYAFAILVRGEVDQLSEFSLPMPVSSTAL